MLEILNHGLSVPSYGKLSYTPAEEQYSARAIGSNITPVRAGAALTGNSSDEIFVYGGITDVYADRAKPNISYLRKSTLTLNLVSGAEIKTKGTRLQEYNYASAIKLRSGAVAIAGSSGLCILQRNTSISSAHETVHLTTWSHSLEEQPDGTLLTAGSVSEGIIISRRTNNAALIDYYIVPVDYESGSSASLFTFVKDGNVYVYKRGRLFVIPSGATVPVQIQTRGNFQDTLHYPTSRFNVGDWFYYPVADTKLLQAINYKTGRLELISFSNIFYSEAAYCYDPSDGKLYSFLGKVSSVYGSEFRKGWDSRNFIPLD